MRQIGIRDWRRRASIRLRRVKQGESFEVTDRGRPIALLIPYAAEDELELLTAAGLLSAAEGDLLDLGPPLPPRRGVPLPSAFLEQTRADERC